MASATPDFAQGVPFAGLTEGEPFLGHVGEEEIIVVRRGNELFALSALCSHYHANLAGGLVVGESIRCPMHHACFDLRTGAVLRAPAMDAMTCWRVERLDDTVFVREKRPAPPRVAPTSRASAPGSVVIVGGGAAGIAAADTLRREGYENAITLISADDTAPYDRPNLSKDYLAGTAPEAWMPLRSPKFYPRNKIDLILNARATRLDAAAKRLTLADGREIPFDALLLATGADPAQVTIPGAPPDYVHYLRTFADCRAIVAKAPSARRVVVLGAGFIALEAAASLRGRNIDVHVIGREQVPMERVLGTQLGRFVKQVHESHGVVFHLGTTITGIDDRTVHLGDGTSLDADFVIAGIGVRPSVSLAEQAGLTTDDVVPVDKYLRTRAPGIYAAGDIAQWPDPVSGSRIRVEHWVLAQRQAQTVARNILGAGEVFAAVPFFWSQHYDATINYIGHATSWDQIEVSGDIAARDCAVRYLRAGRTLAMATLSRDRLNLETELALELEARF
ncbi:MAG: FAD-dependent oxidoreductase [Gammaproteobacteria bacterium]